MRRWRNKAELETIRRYIMNSLGRSKAWNCPSTWLLISFDKKQYCGIKWIYEEGTKNMQISGSLWAQMSIDKMLGRDWRRLAAESRRAKSNLVPADQVDLFKFQNVVWRLLGLHQTVSKPPLSDMPSRNCKLICVLLSLTLLNISSRHFFWSIVFLETCL